MQNKVISNSNVQDSVQLNLINILRKNGFRIQKTLQDALIKFFQSNKFIAAISFDPKTQQLLLALPNQDEKKFEVEDPKSSSFKAATALLKTSLPHSPATQPHEEKESNLSPLDLGDPFSKDSKKTEDFLSKAVIEELLTEAHST